MKVVYKVGVKLRSRTLKHIKIKLSDFSRAYNFEKRGISCYNIQGVRPVSLTPCKKTNNGGI